MMIFGYKSFDGAIRLIASTAVSLALFAVDDAACGAVNVQRNGVTWANTFEGDVSNLTLSTPAWSVFDRNGLASASTDGEIYSYISSTTGTSNSYSAPNWAGTGPARTAEIRLRVPDNSFEATDGSAALTTSNGNAYDLRIYQDKLAFNGTGGLLSPGNVFNIDMSQFRILRIVVDTNAPFIYSLYVDNNPTPTFQRNDSWFSGFDLFNFGDVSTGGLSGKVEVDYISWTPGAFMPGVSNDVQSWVPDSGGDWNNLSNWSTTQIPNGNTFTAEFGGVISSPRTVFTNSPVTVETIRFDSAVSYALAGAGPGLIQLESNGGSAMLEVTGGAGAGAHQLQLPVTLLDNTTADIGSGAKLTFNNSLNLGTNTLTKSGTGTLLINNQLGSGTGQVLVSQGTLGGNGRLYASVTTQSGATVAPGTSEGRLTVLGNYIHEAGATLQIEIGGLGKGINHDVLNVLGNLSVTGGTLEVLLTNEFLPQPGDRFDILDFSSVSGVGFTSINLPAGIYWNTADLLINGALAVASGDFDDDGDVDGNDFLIWQKGFGISSGATLTDGDANGDGRVDGTDLAIWQDTYGLVLNSLSSASVVPEPTASFMITLSWMVVFSGRYFHYKLPLAKDQE